MSRMSRKPAAKATSYGAARWIAGSAGVVVFATFAYTWLTLPDVRPLAGENPATTAFTPWIAGAPGG